MNKMNSLTKTILATFIAALLALAPWAASASDGTWSTAGGGSWNASGNWTGGTIADGTGASAYFTNVTLAADATVTLDLARTIGNLYFGDLAATKHNWFLNTGSAGPLTLAGTTPSFTINSATTTVAAVIIGTAGLSKAGTGTLALSGNNTYTGNTIINAGVFDIGSAGKLYNAAYDNTDVITVKSGGTWRMSDFSYAGVGQLADYAARRVLDGGTIEVTGNTHASGQDFTVTANGGTFRYVPSGQTLTLSGTANDNIALNGPLTFDTLGNIIVSEVMQTASGTGSLIKTGAGTLSLGANSTYNGTSTISVGTVALTGGGGGNGTFPPGGAITVASGATLQISTGDATGYSATGRLTVSGTVSNANASSETVARPITLSGGTITASASAGSSTAGYIGDCFNLFNAAAIITTADNSGNSYISLPASKQFALRGGSFSTGGGSTLNVNANISSYGGSSSFGVTKAGPGTMILNSNNTYTGATAIGAGTLTLGASGAIASSSSLTLTPGAVFDVSAPGGFTLGSGKTLVGGRAINLATDINGNLTNSGTINPGGTGTPGTLTINGNLTLSGPDTLNYDLSPTVSDLIALTGASRTLTLSGTTTVNPNSTFFPNGTYTLINGFSSASGTTANLAWGGTATTVRGTPAAAFAVNASSVTLTISGGTPASLNWMGYSSGAWDVNTTANWTNTATVASDRFYNLDSVTFGDSPITATVSIPSAVYPTSVTFTNTSTTPYTFSGAGAIAGGASVTKTTGNGLVNFTSANTYTGGTTISAGTLSVGNGTTENANALGTGPVAVNTGGTLKFYCPSSTTVYNIPNAINLNGGTIASWDGYQHVTGPVFVGASGGTLTPHWDTKSLWIDGQLTGSGPLTVNTDNNNSDGVHFSNPLNTYAGTITVSSDCAKIDNTYALSNATVNVTGGTGLAWGSGVTSIVLGGLSGTASIANGGNALSVGNNNSSTAYTGVFSGAGSLTKLGTGTFTLTTANTYTGGTIINNGILSLGSGANENVGSLGYGSVAVNSGGRLMFQPGSSGAIFNVTNAVSINGGTIWVEDGKQYLTGPINVTANGGTLSTKWGAKDLWIGGVLSGSGALAVNNAGGGSGTTGVHFTNANNTYSGTITMSSALSPVLVANTYALSNAIVSLGVANGLVWDGVNNIVLGGLTGSGAIANGGNALQAGNNNSSTTYSGVLSGTGSLTKLGTGTFQLGAANTFTGGATVNGGILQANVVSTFANNAANTLTVNNSGTLFFNINNVLANEGTVVATPIVINSGGKLNTASFNTIGNLTLDSGTVQLDKNGYDGGNYGAYYFHGNVTVGTSGASFINYGAYNNAGIHLDAPTTFNVGDSPAANDLTVNVQLSNRRWNSGAGSLYKTGAGTMLLNAANDYTGDTIVGAGKLVLGAGGTIPNGSILVTNNALLDLSAATSILSLGSGRTLTAGRTGTAANDVVGSLTNAGGIINIGYGAGTLATLTLAGNTSTLTLNGGTVNFDLSDDPTNKVNDLISAAGNLALAGTTTFNINRVSGVLGNGAYPLINYAGGLLAGSEANLALSGLPTGGSRQNFALVTTLANKVLLNVTGNPAHLFWVGYSNVWDVSVTNWHNADNANADDAFVIGDVVIFDDSATTKDVNLASTLVPGAVTFSNVNSTYTLGGPGYISGVVSLTKNGAGLAVITNANNYSGQTLVNGGTLMVLGSNTNSGPTVVSNGVFQIGNGGTNGASGTGPLFAYGSGTVLFYLTNSPSITNTFAGTGRLLFQSSGNSNEGSYSLTGNNTNFVGAMTANNARVIPGSQAALGASPFVTATNGGQIYVPSGTLTNGFQIAGDGWTETAGNLGALRVENATVSGPVTLLDNARVTTYSGNGTISGVISGNYALEKTNGNTLYLLASNTYSGGTLINGGIVSLGNNANENGTSLGRGLVSVNTGGRLAFAPGSSAVNFYITNSVSLNGGTVWVEDGAQHLTGPISVTANGATLNTKYTAKDLYLDGIITGSGLLTVADGGGGSGGTGQAVHFSNPLNSFNGTITVSSTAAKVTNPYALSNAIVNVVANNGLLWDGVTSIVLGGLTGSGSIANSGNALTVGNNGVTTNYSGILSGTGSLTKVGNGVFTLDAASTYTGNTIVSGGTLALSTSASISNSATLSVASGSTLDVSAVNGTFNLNTNQALTGFGTVQGQVTANSNSIVIPGAGAVAGTLTFNSKLILNQGSKLNFDLAAVTTEGASVNDLINVLGDVVLNGPATATISQLATTLAVGSYRLINYTGALVGDAVLNLVVGSSLPSTRYTYTIDTNTPGQINLIVANNALSGLIWRGGLNGNAWDLATTTNWDNAGTPDRFFTEDIVTFNNDGGTNPVAYLASALYPYSVIVNSDTNYTFAGNGSLTGPMSLTKQGSSTLTISSTNTYTGNTVVSGGTLRVGSSNALGNSSAIISTNGGQVDLNGLAETGKAYNYTISGAGPDGNGAIKNSTTSIGANSGVSNLTLVGNATVGAFGTAGTDAGRFDLMTGGALNASGYTLTKVGNGPFVVHSASVLSLPEIIVNNGLVYSENYDNNLGSKVTVNSGGAVGAYNGRNNNAQIDLNGGTLATAGGAMSTWNGLVNVLANSTVNSGSFMTGYAGSDIKVAGTLSGSAGLTIAGGAYSLELSANNDATYSGNMTISSGNGLRLSGAGTAGTGYVTNNSVINFLTSPTNANVNFVKNIVGSGNVYHANGSGSVTLTGTNSMSNLIVESGNANNWLTLASGSSNYIATYLGVAVDNNIGKLQISPGAKLTVNGNFWLGEQASRAGDVVQNGGDVVVNSGFRVGHWPTEISTYTMNGGTLTLTANPGVAGGETAGVFNLGIDGVGLYRQTGGTVTAPSIVLDNRASTTVSGQSSSFALEGGTFTVGQYGISSPNTTYNMHLGGGTLGANASWSSSLNLNITGTNGPITFDSGPYTIGLSGTLSGSGGLVKAGLGTLVISGTPGYSGSTTISNGLLSVRSGSLAGSLSVRSNGVLAVAGSLVPGTLTVSNDVSFNDRGGLVFDLANVTTVGGGVNDLLDVKSNLTLSGTVPITFNLLSGVPATSGYYVIARYLTLSGGAANLQPSGATHYTITIDDSVTNEIRVSFSGSGANLTWRGDGVNNLWDGGVSLDWWNGTSLDFFGAGDKVTFDNTGSNNVPVSLVGTLLPTSVTVDAAQDYVLSGSGKISGVTSLAKLNSGKLTIGTTNDFSGITTISGGIVSISTDNNLGATPATATPGKLVLNGGTLQSTANLTLSANRGIAVGPASGSGSGSLDVASGMTLTYSGIVTNNGTGTGTLLKTGAGTLTLTGASTLGGGMNVNGGTLVMQSGGTLPATSLIMINNNGTFIFGSVNTLPFDTRFLVNNGGWLILTNNTGATAFHGHIGNLTLAGGNVLGSAGAPWQGESFRIDGALVTVTGTAPSVITVSNWLAFAGGSHTLDVADVTGNAAPDLTINGPVINPTDGGTVSLVKTNGGTLLLNGANTYTGGTSIDGGQLSLGPNASISNSLPGIGLGTVAEAATNSGSSSTIFDVSSVNGGFNLNTNQALGGYGTVLGRVSVNANSILNPGSNPFVSPGTLSFSSNLVLNAGAKANYDLTSATTVGGGVNDLINVGGDLVINGSVTITVTPQPALVNGTYRLFNYTGNLVGDAVANLHVVNSVSSTRTYAFTIDTNTPNQVKLIVIGALSGNLVWRGTPTADWNLGGTVSNWLNGVNPDIFFSSDPVLFNDTRASTAPVNLTTTLLPLAVVVNTTNSYTLGGVGKISGTTSLTKQGSGTLTLNTANDYSGGSTIAGGLLKIGNASALGAPSGSLLVTVNSNAQFDVAGFTLSTYAKTVVINGQGLAANSGAVINSGAALVNVGLPAVTLGSDAAIGNDGLRLDIIGALTGGGFNLTKVGNDFIALKGAVSGVNSFIINAGVLDAEVLLGTASVVANPNGDFYLWHPVGLNWNNNLTLNGGIWENNTGNNTWSGPVTLDAAANPINIVANSLVVSSVISGSGGLSKGGAGLLSLGTVDTYYGDTVISAGTLTLQATGSISNSANISVASNAFFDVTALSAFGLASNQTLLGSGTVSGAVADTNGGAFILPGGSNVVGTLTISSNLTLAGGGTLGFDLGTVTNEGGAFNDLLNVGGNLTLSGVTTIRIAPTAVLLTNGGAYTLINYAGTLTTNGDNFVIISDTRYEFTLDFTVPNKVLLRVPGSGPISLTWYGNDENAFENWDERATPAWQGQMFYQGDQVRFDGGANSPDVLLVGALRPGAIYVKAENFDYTFRGDGRLTGETGLTKDDVLALVLSNTGSNNYTGPTVINDGTLQIGDGGTAGNLPAATLVTNHSTLAFNRSDTVTVGNTIVGDGTLMQRGSGTLILSGPATFLGTTLVENGTLAGTGTLAGPVQVQAGGTIAPGPGLGTLTISSNLTLEGQTGLEISKSGGLSDHIVVGRTLTYGGTLVVTNLAGTLAAGDIFTLFTATSYAGAFATCSLPALSAGLGWDTSRLAIDGSLTVRRLVTVSGSVVLEGYVGTNHSGTGQRTVQFAATDSTNHVMRTWDVPLTFTTDAFGNGVAGYTLTDVLDGAAHLSAKTAWTLRKRLDLTFSNNAAPADFTGAALLPAGDINNSNPTTANKVDLDDYYLLASLWYQVGPTGDAADIDGSGTVDMDDYFLLSNHWGATGDAP